MFESHSRREKKKSFWQWPLLIFCVFGESVRVLLYRSNFGNTIRLRFVGNALTLLAKKRPKLLKIATSFHFWNEAGRRSILYEIFLERYGASFHFTGKMACQRRAGRPWHPPSGVRAPGTPAPGWRAKNRRQRRAFGAARASGSKTRRTGGCLRALSS